MPTSWWEEFFDADYLHLWSGIVSAARTQEEVNGLWGLLGLQEGTRLLDAPCGYGRLSRPLAERGAVVLGVDQSAVLIEQARRDAGLREGRLRYLRHDLRLPLDEGHFDVAINVFTSLGYGTEAEDVAVLRTLRDAVHPGGLVFLETHHRDAVVARLARGNPPGYRLPDGTLVVEEPRFDPITGRVETHWFWAGPQGSGEKSASIRLYTATELVALLERVGLRFRSAHKSCAEEAYAASGADMGGRLGLLAERP